MRCVNIIFIRDVNNGLIVRRLVVILIKLIIDIISIEVYGWDLNVTCLYDLIHTCIKCF